MGRNGLSDNAFTSGVKYTYIVPYEWPVNHDDGVKSQSHTPRLLLAAFQLSTQNLLDGLYININLFCPFFFGMF
jgi:hypothetical protein